MPQGTPSTPTATETPMAPTPTPPQAEPSPATAEPTTATPTSSASVGQSSAASSLTPSSNGKSVRRQIVALKQVLTADERRWQQEQSRAHRAGEQPNPAWKTTNSGEESGTTGDDDDGEGEEEADSPAGEPDFSCSVCAHDQDEIVIQCRDCAVRIHPSCQCTTRVRAG